MAFRLLAMLFEAGFQLLRSGRPRHFRQGAKNLPFGKIDVLERIVE